MKTTTKICFLFVILLTGSAFGQNKQTTLILKDGSQITGELLESENGKVKIENSCHDIWSFEMDKIQTIQTTKCREISQKKGFYNLLDAGIMIGSGQNTQPQAGVRIGGGFYFTPKFAAGLNVGIEAVDGFFFPITAGARYHILGSDPSVYVGLNGGFGFAHNDYYSPLDDAPNSVSGGPVINPTLGITNYFNENLGFNFEMGYRFSQISKSRYHWELQSHFPEVTQYHRIEVRAGLLIR